MTASTHNEYGILQGLTPEALNNSVRLQDKIVQNAASYCFYQLDEEKDASTLLVSYGITAQACREAVQILREKGEKISLLIAKTLLPIPETYYDIIDRYKTVIFAEENLNGQLRQIMYGSRSPKHIIGVTSFGKMINPQEIIREVENYGS